MSVCIYKYNISACNSFIRLVVSTIVRGVVNLVTFQLYTICIYYCSASLEGHNLII